MTSRVRETNDRPSLAATIERQRQQLFKASAVVDVCRYACASQYDGFDVEQLALALQVADDLVSGAASELHPLCRPRS